MLTNDGSKQSFYFLPDSLTKGKMKGEVLLDPKQS